MALRLLLLASLILPPPSARAQGPYTVRELADGVYAVVRGPFQISDSNVLFIVNDDDVVVVDANIFPSSAREVIAEIRKVTSKPVRFVINTHWHSDHHYGNGAYAREYPGVQFIQHENTRRDIIARDVPTLATNLETEYPKQAAAYRRALETGVTSTGATVTPTMRTNFQALLGIYETFLADMRTTPVVPGTITFRDSLILHRGERRIAIKYLGLGNTAGDVVVHLPRERILATGDLVVHPMPYSFFSYLREWPGTLRALKALDATTIVPGHGTIQADWSYVDELIPLIESTWEQVSRAVESGADLDETRKRVDLERFRVRFTAGDSTQRGVFDYLFTNAAIDAAFQQLRPDSSEDVAATADSGFAVERLADGIHAVIRREPQGVINESNTLFIVSDTGVLVVDAQSSSARTRETLAAIRRVTDKPVRTVVNTHWHDDHVVGNEVYREAFPGVQIIAHATATEDLATLGVQFRQSTHESRAGTIQFLRGLVERRTSFAGGSISDDEARSHTLSAWLLGDYGNAAADFRPLPPTRTVTDRLTITLGGRQVDIIHPGRGHTRGDLVVYLPQERILAAGDLVMWPVPFVGSTSFPAEFATTMASLRALHPARVVPGHGRVLHGEEADRHMATVERMLTSVVEQARAAVARGDSLPQARQAINLDAFRDAIAGDHPVRKILFGYYVTGSAIPRAFEQASAPSRRPDP